MDYMIWTIWYKWYWIHHLLTGKLDLYRVPWFSKLNIMQSKVTDHMHYSWGNLVSWSIIYDRNISTYPCSSHELHEVILSSCFLILKIGKSKKTMCNFNRYEERNVKVFNARIGLAMDPDLSIGIKLQMNSFGGL